MLTILTGKSAAVGAQRVLQSVKSAAQGGKKGIILLVPEQQSHDYERMLCRCCAPEINLSAEVLSFSRLAGRVETELGGAADKVLDKGGRVLLMSMALSSVRSALKVYSSVSEKPDFIARLLESSDELKSCRIAPEDLAQAAPDADTALSDKLHDVSLICLAYNALCANIALDPKDRLTRLAEKIGHSRVCDGEVFVSGFTDLTEQEIAVIAAFLSAGTDITVSLCCPESEEKNQGGVFSVELKTKRRLLRLAEDTRCETKVLHDSSERKRAESLSYLAENLFAEKTGDRESDGEENGEVELLRCQTLAGECETAAAKVLELVRAGYRYRDIAVVSRGFDSIATAVESVFRYYGVPVFLSRMADILKKPVMSLLLYALECVSGFWDHEALFRYLRTDLAGLSMDECDTLESYVLTWNIRGAQFTSGRDWTQNPSGYKSEITQEEKERLIYINSLRSRAVSPLLRLRERGRKAKSAAEQARALYAFMEEIALAANLENRAQCLAQAGDKQRADEYRQLWDIIIGALEQTAALLDEKPMGQQEFLQLLRLVLSQYDVGSIPQSADCVSLGDLSRLSAGELKCLIIMDAGADRLPAVTEGRGMFSDFERIELEGLGIELSDSPNDRLMRELGDIYAAICAPEDKLIISCRGGSGSEPSFVMTKTAEILGLEMRAESDERRMAAPEPCFALAVSSSISDAACLARAYMESYSETNARLGAVLSAAAQRRGALSKDAAGLLYGKNITLSASKADKFVRCRFSYFMRYGLRAKVRRAAGIDAPQTGLFVHYVLEKTTERVRGLGGFSKVSDGEVRHMASGFMREYLDETFGGISDKNGRFRYLFSRLEESTLRMLDDMSGELKASLFEPVGFEMAFSDEQGDGSFTLTGAVDRVDGYISGGKLYLRVVDYKTGRKSFDLSDIWYGLGMQTLIYLFELWKNGGRIYGREIVPAGVLYAPARDIILNARRDVTDEQIDEAMAKELTRSGLLLDDGAIIRAMETGEKPRYLPVKLKNGEATGAAIASLERFGQLSRHIDRALCGITAAIKSGSISAEPYFENRDKGECDRCDYRAACLFDDDRGDDKKRFLRHVGSEEVWQKIAEEEEHGRA